MKKNLCSVFFVLLWGSVFSQSSSPTVISGAGDFFETAEVSLSWTLGEPIIETFTSDDLMLTQGFHQGSLIVTATEEFAALDYQISVYPNPTASLLNIKVQSPQEEVDPLWVELFDLQGKMLNRQQIDPNSGMLDFQQFPPGMFLLKVSTSDRNHLKTFKIIKVN